MVALLGRLPGAPVDEPPPAVEVVLGTEVPPLLGGYLIPDEGQEPAFGALMGTKVPSMIDPFKLKYQLIWFKAPDSQSSAGVKPPDCAANAVVNWDRVKVLDVLGVIPSFSSQVNVGNVWNSLTTVWKNATASAPLTLPLGKHLGTRVLMQVPWVAHSCSQNCSFWPLISTQCVFMNERVSLAPLLVNKLAIPVYAREGSQFSSKVVSQLSGQRPWMVQLLDGPVDGFVSQNWVCSSSPPGASKQHRFDTEELLWHDVWPEVEHPDDSSEDLSKS